VPKLTPVGLKLFWMTSYPPAHFLAPKLQVIDVFAWVAFLFLRVSQWPKLMKRERLSTLIGMEVALVDKMLTLWLAEDLEGR